MSDKEKEVQVEVLEPQVSVKVDISKEDLLAITVYEHERKLDEAKRVLSEKLSVTQKERDKLSLEIEKSVAKAGADKFDAEFQGAIKGIKAFGFTVTGKLSASLVSNDDDEENAKDKFKSVIKVTFTINTDRSSHYGSSVSAEKTTFVPAEIKAMINKRDGLNEEIDRMQSKVIEIRKAMDNMGKNERAAKAQLAKMNLEQTANGRKALAALQDQANMPGARLLGDGKDA